MELILQRWLDNHETTIGPISIDGLPFCMGLEDTFRHDKVYGETRIAAGRYEIKMRYDSPMEKRYRKRYRTKGMIHLQDVSGFKYVYIHIGNDEDDSDACILCGRSAVLNVIDRKLKYTLMRSTDAYQELHARISAALDTGDHVFITILDN
ncbi:hypothetical protein KAR91_23620 [Candidatus Pacearchaeota archaeon]|nr:hypothetical protein [Candidatus Pacearchaeota archaeon]